MSDLVIVTGSGGLIGSEAVAHFCSLGYRVIGLDNDMRAYFFGQAASTSRRTSQLTVEFDAFKSLDIDIRDRDGVMKVFRGEPRPPVLVIHAAAQPSHDWAAREPHTDFSVNAVGTLNLLEASRHTCPDAPFIFMSTNKVYGDTPNSLPLVELDTRWELPSTHEWFGGIPTNMTIDRSTHSVFGASKVAADILVQEYGRYFGMPTACFRGGCLTGPQHAGAQLHGFLSYLMKCTVTREPYTIFGYGGKQVRDNIHAHDVVRAFEAFAGAPISGAVYNLGGGRSSNVSMIEAIRLCEAISDTPLQYEVSDRPRKGDHQWYVSDFGEFESQYPGWKLTYGIEAVLREIYDVNVDRWLAVAEQR